MDFKNVLGYIASAVSTVSLFPQLIKTWKTKSTKDIALELTILGSLGSFLWLIYGLLINAKPVIVANTLVFICFIILLIFKLKYK